MGGNIKKVRTSLEKGWKKVRGINKSAKAIQNTEKALLIIWLRRERTHQ